MGFGFFCWGFFFLGFIWFWISGQPLDLLYDLSTLLSLVLYQKVDDKKTCKRITGNSQRLAIYIFDTYLNTVSVFLNNRLFL